MEFIHSNFGNSLTRVMHFVFLINPSFQYPHTEDRLLCSFQGAILGRQSSVLLCLASLKQTTFNQCSVVAWKKCVCVCVCVCVYIQLLR